MKLITINVSEPVYRDLKRLARDQDRTASEVIREAMAEYRERRRNPGRSLADLAPISLGKVIRPLRVGDDLLGEMLHDARG